MARIIFISLLIFSQLLAQTKYQSKLLYSIHKQLVVKNLLTRGNPIFVNKIKAKDVVIVYRTKNFSKGVKVIFRSDSTVAHIGLNLFPSANTYDSFLELFTERFLLTKIFNLRMEKYFNIERNKALVAYNGKTANKRMNLKISKLLESRFNVKKKIKNNEFSISFTDSIGNQLKIITPINVNFIYGMDKKELDDYWLYRIKNVSLNNITTMPVAIKRLNSGKFNDSIYIFSGKKLLDGLDQNIYLKKSNNKFVKIFDNKFPDLSLKNVFQIPKLKNLQINIKFHLYPKKIVSLKKEFSTIDYVLSQGNEKFVGFEKLEKGSYVYLIVYFNPILKTSHLLSIKVPSEFVNLGKSTSASAELYTDIRNDNLSNIFKKYSKKQSKFKLNFNK
jgi:hypothetical protein